MKVGQVYEGLLWFIYDKYQRSDAFRRYGEFPWTLVSEFRRVSGIDMGDGGAQLEAIQFLVSEGWLEVSTKRVSPQSMVQLTPSGIRHVEQSRALGRRLMGPLGNVAELIGRFWEGFFDR